MKFKKHDLIELSHDDEPDGFTLIENDIVDSSRWSIMYELIFGYGDKFYRSIYSVGATEQQDESPYEYDGDEIECEEVRPVQKTITVYEKV